MARAARYGNIPPSDFLEMDWEDASELARRVTEMHLSDLEQTGEMHVELTKAQIKAQGGKVI